MEINRKSLQVGGAYAVVTGKSWRSRMHSDKGYFVEYVDGVGVGESWVKSLAIDAAYVDFDPALGKQGLPVAYENARKGSVNQYKIVAPRVIDCEFGGHRCAYYYAPVHNRGKARRALFALPRVSMVEGKQVVRGFSLVLVALSETAIPMTWAQHQAAEERRKEERRESERKQAERDLAVDVRDLAALQAVVDWAKRNDVDLAEEPYRMGDLDVNLESLREDVADGRDPYKRWTLRAHQDTRRAARMLAHAIAVQGANATALAAALHNQSGIRNVVA